MTHEEELQIIHAVVATNDPVTPQRLGLQPEHLTSPVARLALTRIYEYAGKPASLGEAPATSWLLEHGIPMQGHYDPNGGTLKARIEAARTAFLKGRLISNFGTLAGAAAANPHLAYEQALEMLHAKDLTDLVTEGEGKKFSSMVGQLIATYDATIMSGGLTGTPSPFGTMNASLKGFKSGNLYTLYAPPKNYKSFTLLYIARYVYETWGKRILVITSEMTFEEMAGRLFCMLNKIDFNAWIDRTVDTQQWDNIKDDAVVWQAKAGMDVEFFKPSGLGDKAIAEARGKIQEVNFDGQLGLAMWDGHYRSAKSEEWKDVYDLVRKTRAMILDPSTGKPPMLITAQEGSKKGVVNMRAYEQESTALMFQQKMAAGLLNIHTVYLREGRGFSMQAKLDFATMQMEELAGELEQSGSSAEGAGVF